MKAFFDTIDHDLMMQAIDKHVSEKWIRLYIRRWLDSPVELVKESCKNPAVSALKVVSQTARYIASNHSKDKANKPGYCMAVKITGAAVLEQ